jgi:hypothetical protein
MIRECEPGPSRGFALDCSELPRRKCQCDGWCPIELFSTRAFLELATVEGHTSEVVSLVADPSGERVASLGRDLRVRIWRLGAE